MKRLLLFLACAAAFAADVTGPVSGYVLEEGSVRPILGIPSAARVAQPVLANALAISSISGLALTCTEGTVHLVALQTGKSTRVEDLQGCPDQALFSPSGSAAALFYSSRVVTLRGTAIAAEAESATACSPSDDAERLLCSTGAQVRILDAYGALRATHQARIAAFLPGSHDAVAATESEIVLLRDGAGPEPLAAFDGATSLAGVAGYSTVVAAREDRVLAVSVVTRAATTLQAPAAVLALHPVRSGDALHVATGAQGPLWLLTLDSGRAALIFVPREEASNE